MAIEARALLKGRTRGTTVVRTGAGAHPAHPVEHGPFVVAGVCGALDDVLSPGDVVVASEVRGADGHVRPMPGAVLLAGALRRAGHTVHLAPLHSAAKLVHGRAARRRLAATGVVAVDLETAPLLATADATAVGGSAVAQAVRVVVDTPRRPLLRPATVGAGLLALRTLSAITPVLEDWLATIAPRTAVLAGPRSFCAGVERAIATVERALDRGDGPVYVRRQIVHNAYVVAGLESRGAVFVQELDEVPERATVVLSAHGVSPAVRAEAAERHLTSIDATCPLVAKVHVEARRAAETGRSVVLIGHAGHEEVEGTVGEAPGTLVVETVADVAALDLPDADNVSYLMQTTLAVDEAAVVEQALTDRFPTARGPAGEDICYATSNRQQAVRAVAAETDLVLVLGSPNSSNSRRLVEVAERCGTRARLVEDAGEVDLHDLVRARSVGVTAGASAPPQLVDELVTALRGLGHVDVREVSVTREDLTFELPREVRHP
jgi:4-hydroxy-3-methylbut-2-enyl diphosphate reductase